MEKVLQSINAFLWGVPVLILILVIGVYLSFRSGFAQLKLLPAALRQFVRSLKGDDGHRSGYRALCTALAATVGTGNIAGVAGAIALGGPGVVFWMWVCALLGMITKLAEVTLAIKFRVKYDKQYLGGPMYIIEKGLPKKYRFLATFYCYFGIVAAFGVGNATQVNAVIDSVKYAASMYQIDIGMIGCIILGSAIAVLILAAFWKDNGRIGAWAEKLVPFASVLYILMAVGMLAIRNTQIPDAIKSIVVGAFSPKSATCGVISSMFLSLRVGASRGVFTNEAGMGTASIAHTSADVSDPIEQGLMGIVEVFLDTIVICTLTALVILCSGVPIPYGTDPGITLTINAFSTVYGDWSKFVIAILISVFAFATILGWGLYGTRCARYLFGEKSWRIFGIAHAACIIVGTLLNTSTVWVFSEIVNGLMAIPNLIALVYLSPVFLSIIQKHTHKEKAYSIK